MHKTFSNLKGFVNFEFTCYSQDHTFNFSFVHSYGYGFGYGYGDKYGNSNNYVDLSGRGDGYCNSFGDGCGSGKKDTADLLIEEANA